MKRTHPPYPSEEKARILARLLPPNPEPIRSVALSEKVSEPTLRKWLADAAGEDEENDSSQPHDTSGLSSEQKFLVVIETAAMDETSLGEYAREHGLYAEDIKRWTRNCRQSNASLDIGDEPQKVQNLRKELKECRSEIHEKDQEIKRLTMTISDRDKTIAEESAIIFLQKKTFQRIAST